MKKYFIHIFVAILILSSAFPTFSVSALSKPRIIEPEPQILRAEQGRRNPVLTEEVTLHLQNRNEPVEERLYGAPTAEHTGLTRAQVESYTCIEGMDVPKPECEALVALYNSTNGAGWANNGAWLTGSAVGNWYGVTVTSGFVSHIELDGNQLSGSIPGQLGNLTSLVELSLMMNQLSGSIPPQLGNLTSLKNLFLSSNYLTGSIPTDLGKLTNLEWLDLTFNQLSGRIPSQLGNLKILVELWLGYNQLLTGNIPLSFTNLIILSNFSFEDTNLCEPTNLHFQAWKASVSEGYWYGTERTCIVPVAAAEAYTTPEDTELVIKAAQGLLANDSDSDGDPLSAALVADVTNGILALATDGSFTYTPNLDFTGDDSFTYEATDGELYSDVVTVTIMVNQALYSIYYLPLIIK